MKRFELSKQTADFTFQSRIENAGPEKKPAATCHFSMTVSNTILERLDAKLREAFYRKELPQDDPADLADQGLVPNDGLNRTKFSKIVSAIDWNETFENYALSLDHGIADEPAIELGDCKADGFKITFLDGGSILLKFRVACHPDAEQAGLLHSMSGSQVTMHLQPAKVSAKKQRELEEA